MLFASKFYEWPLMGVECEQSSHYTVYLHFYPSPIAVYGAGMERFLSRFSPVFLACTAACVALLLYVHPALVNEFVTFDDSVLITRNAAVQRFTLSAVWHFFTSYDPELYVPLTMLSLQLTHALFGLQPWAFHLGNLLLHMLSCAMVFFVVERLTGSKTRSLFVAMVFAVHPLNTEAVLWAAARKDVLAAAFCLISFWAYLRLQETGEKKFFVLSLGVFTLGLLSKVSIVTLPVIFLLLALMQRETLRTTARRLWPYVVIAVLFGLIALFGKRGILESSSVAETIILTVRSLGWYIAKVFAAWDFAVIYPAVRPVTVDVMTVVSGISLCFIAGLAWFLRRRSPLILLGVSWYVLFVLPNSTNYLKNGFLYAASDRYAYLAMVGILLAVSELANLATSRGGILRHAQMAVASLAIVALSASSVVQAQTWRTSETMYRNVLRRSPESTLALTNLAVVVRLDKERKDEGEMLIREALRIDPQMVQALVNMGQIEKERGNIDAAQEYFERGVAVLNAKNQRFFGLDDLGAYYFLSEVLEAKGDRNAALTVLQSAVARAPQLAEPHHNLALMLQKMGRTDEAIPELIEAIRLEPMYIHSLYILAGILAERGHLPEARELLLRVIAINPGYEKARQHLVGVEKLLEQ